MISQREQKDLDALKEKQAQIRNNAFDMCREYMHMDAESLAHCGQRNGVDAAIASTIKDALRQIEQEAKKFVKKWPD